MEEAEEGGSKTDAPVGCGNHNIAHKDQYTVIKNGDYDDKDGSDQAIDIVMRILTEQSIPENSGSQTQVFMFEHFWVGRKR